MIYEMATGEGYSLERPDIGTQISVNFGDALSADEFALKSYVDARFDEQNYKKITASFSDSPKTYEKGSSVSNPVFNVTFGNQKPTAVTWQGNAVTALVGKQSGSLTATGTFTAAQSWQLSAHHETAGGVLSSNATATASIRFWDCVFYGAADMPETVDSAFVRSLSEQNLSGSFTNCTISTLNAEDSQYMWFALPSAFGEVKFMTGGFAGGWDQKETVNVKNGGGSGTDVAYYVYHTTYPGIGAQKVIVEKA